MASILTNTSAMVALQNLRSINSNLVDAQNQIATGKKIATARDNSAIWAVSKVLESDVQGFQAISDSLNLGDATVGVARAAAETVSDLLTELKGNIVAAQEENVDRSKIQADIDAKVDQIQSIVSAAQFNGLSLVEGTEEVTILGSLQRSSTGAVTASDISLERADLSSSSGAFNTAGTDISANTTLSGASVANTANTAAVTFAGSGADYSAAAATLTVGGQQINYSGSAGETEAEAAAHFAAQINDLDIDGLTASSAAGVLTISSTQLFESTAVEVSGLVGNAGGSQITSLNGGAVTVASGTIDQRAESITFDDSTGVVEGDGYQLTLGGQVFNYIAGPGEDYEDVARGLKAVVDAGNIAGVTTEVSQDETTGDWVLSFDNDNASALSAAVAGRDGGTASGGLFGLAGIDVLTNESARAALQNIDTFLNTAVDAASSFGSSQSRIDLQSGFISTLTDSLKAGIGALVDADLEAASARLQALQVQQQLGIQSLSIANQAPQTILSLFR